MNISGISSNYTNSSNNAETNDSPVYASQLSSRITFLLMMITGILGIFGNALSVTGFIKSNMSKTGVGLLLIGIAFGDTLFLIGHILISMFFASGWITYQLLDHSEFLCKTVFYTQYASQLWVSLQTLVLTFERYLSVAYPLKLKQFNVLTLTKRFMVITFIFSFAICSYTLVTLGVVMYSNGPYCQILPNYGDDFDLLDLIIIRIFADVLIGIVIAIFTGLIIKSLYQVHIQDIYFIVDPDLQANET